ncbi:aldo/keto reductase [Rhizohabitans arisaemae]|uniref:aldo/keto reductase n=1 Tax=Rhizohabitans arisaemae TaxID=2720610 RepID=UPI0024B2834E|nr:aldo/keto reductase [Rhizohabitans arisaemae]
MQQITLGNSRTSFPASRLALGAMSFGTLIEEKTAFAILDRFADAGGTLVDTANSYAFWHEGATGDESETVIGKWLASRGARDRVVLSTKVGARPTVPGDRTMDFAEGLSATAIKQGIEGSLRRLGTDHVDVYWAHIEDRRVPLDETLDAFDSLTKLGRVRLLGASNHRTWLVERARAYSAAQGRTGYTNLQLRHSYIRPRPGAALPEGAVGQVGEETLDYVRHEPDLVLWVYTSLISGAYTRRDRPLPEAYDHPGTTRRLALLRDLSAELGVTPNQLVLAWLAGGDPPIIPIVGVSGVEQLEEVLGAFDLTLDEEVRRRMDTPA